MIYTINGASYDSNYLAHHGIKGMKWGVRRYQNPDGSLTAVGRKRYGVGERAYRDINRAVKAKKREQHGWTPGWSSSSIGPNSQRLMSDHDKKRKQYYDSKEYKNYEKRFDQEMRRLDNDFESGMISISEYDAQVERLYDSRPKKNFNDYADWAVSYGSNGREYLNGYLNKGGRDITIAYIKDLGFDDASAKFIADQIIRANRTVR